MMENEKIKNGIVTFFNAIKHFGFIEDENFISYYFFIDIRATVKKNRDLRKLKLPEIRTKYDVGDNVTFKIRKINDKTEAFEIEYLGNNRKQSLVDKFAQERVLKGYLKQIGDMFYVKDIDTYILIPIEIKEIETDIDSVYTDRINQIVEFELHETDNLDKLTATLCDRKIDSICNKIKQCFETQEIIKGVVKQKRKCGLSIAMSKNSNFSAFLPSSQIDIKKNVNYDDLIGKEIELRVIQFNEESGNTVVSRRAVIKEQLEKRKNQFFSDLKIGQVVKGIVSNIQKYGAFVDLGDAVGLIFISELSDEKIKNINDILSVGQEINAVVLNIDEEKKRISLGLKQYLSLTPKIKIKPTGEKIDLNTILDAAPKKTLSRREKKRKISERQRQKKLTEQIIKRKLMEENNLIL